MSLPALPAARSADPDIEAPEGAVEVAATAGAARLDRFLADAVTDVSRSRLKGLIEGGCVLRDGVAVTDASAAVPAGARYWVVLPPLMDAIPLAEDIPLTVLYEDAHLIVLDKPAGLVVHPAPGSPNGTLVNALLAHCGESLPGIGGERRPGIVHRLDKDTSGVMVVAKTELALARLSAAFAARDLERAYVAVCWGRPSPGVGEIDGSIGRDPRDRKRMAVVRGGGKQALTRYVTERSWPRGEVAAASLLTCRLATGRTHQIRVHLTSSGHPLVGDPVYLRRVPAVAKLLSPELRGRLLDFPRQALHAARLGFAHPITGIQLDFERPPPEDMRALIAALDSGDGATR
jgi:23S rRNA pseudouridine1911/1915/1917 synthase